MIDIKRLKDLLFKFRAHPLSPINVETEGLELGSAVRLVLLKTSDRKLRHYSHFPWRGFESPKEDYFKF